MSLLQSLIESVRSWRRRRGGPKTRKRAGVAVERLDHRQLLAVNFTGNVAIDFPAPGGPGVVVLPANVNPNDPNADQVAEIPQYLQPLVPVSGFNIQALYVSYDPSTDILSIGIDQPNAGRGTGKDVIAGDADDNGNEGNPAFPSPPLPPPVDPAVALAAKQQTGFDFLDFPSLAGSEGMYIFLDLNRDNLAEVVAGFPNDPLRPNFEVARAVTNGNPLAAPTFGAPLPQYQGSFFLANDPQHPNLELQITKFSELFLAETGQTLNPNNVVGIGAFAGSDADDGISSTFIKFKSFTIGDTVEPEEPCICPEVWVNPHEHRHINTAHPTDVRVHVLGSATFDVSQIDAETVELSGAEPYLDYIRPVNRDPYPDRTFVFNSLDIELPGGLVDAVLTGELENGQEFSANRQVFVRNDSFYNPADLAARDRKREAGNLHSLLTPFQQKLFHNGLLEIDPSSLPTPAATPTARVARSTATPLGARGRVASASIGNNTVSIPRRNQQAVMTPVAPASSTVRIPGRNTKAAAASSLRVVMTPAS